MQTIRFRNITMSIQKPSGALAPQTLAKLAPYLDRVLSFGIYTPKSRLEGPEIECLVHLDRIVWLSLETLLPPFVVRQVVRKVRVGGTSAYDKRKFVVKPIIVASANAGSAATKQLASLLAQHEYAFHHFSPADLAARHLEHAPHLRLLLEVFFSHRVRECRKKDCFRFPSVDPLDALAYNGFVAQFRQAMHERKLVRRELHNWNLSSRQNVPNLRAYLDGQFTRHRSVTVLHLQLFHTRRPVNLITAPVEEQHSNLRALRACRTRFFDRMRRKPALFTDAPGYVWAILPALEGGYYLHLTLLFNTAALQKVLEDRKVEAELAGALFKDLADAIGAYWIRVGTHGEGSYLRGDQRAWLYGPDWEDGEVHADHVMRCEKLREILGLMAMRRALVRLKNEPDGEYFGMQERKARSSRRTRCGGTEAS